MSLLFGQTVSEFIKIYTHTFTLCYTEHIQVVASFICLFIGSCSCNKTERTVRTICAGPSTPPCVCTSSQSCKVSYHFISLQLIHIIFTV